MIIALPSHGAQQILDRIVDDYRRASKAEEEFVEWERAHRLNGQCEEFAERFYAWLDASEPFIAGKSVIEEQFPEFVDEMTARLNAIT